MGVLGKDLFDIDRPRTHVKVQFGQNAYWVEHDPTPHPYGEVLTELLNYNVAPYEHTISVLEQSIEEKDAQAAPRAPGEDTPTAGLRLELSRDRLMLSGSAWDLIDLADLLLSLALDPTPGRDRKSVV